MEPTVSDRPTDQGARRSGALRRRGQSTPPARSWSPWWIPAAIAGYLLLAYAVIWAVDVRRVFGDPAQLQEAGLDPPLMWVQLFMDGGLTELIQWSMLAAIVILAAGLGARHRGEAASYPSNERSAHLGVFWTLVAVMAALMLIEDAGNPRHLLRHYAGLVGGVDSNLDRPVETLYFGAIASIGVYAFLRHGRDLIAIPTVRVLGALGAGLYALAVVMSAARSVGGFYLALGGWLIDDVLRVPMIVDEVMVSYLAVFELDLRFFFVDFVIEESLEVLGAAFLLAAVVAYRRRAVGSTPGSARGREAEDPRPADPTSAQRTL